MLRFSLRDEDGGYSRLWGTMETKAGTNCRVGTPCGYGTVSTIYSESQSNDVSSSLFFQESRVQPTVLPLFSKARSPLQLFRPLNFAAMDVLVCRHFSRPLNFQEIFCSSLQDLPKSRGALRLLLGRISQECTSTAIPPLRTVPLLQGCRDVARV
jgi:hypothetical protein